MYAVVKIKGSSSGSNPGSRCRCRCSDEVGAEVNFDEVLMVADGQDVKVGNPIVAGDKVAAEVLPTG